MPEGERRVMDCIDCHNRASHTFVTAEEGLNRAMADGAVSPSLPWVHKEGLALLKADYASQDEASQKIPARARSLLSQQQSGCADDEGRPGAESRAGTGHTL